MKERYCPKCGAYWSCDCTFEEMVPAERPSNTAEAGCPHDWVEAIGVDLDEALNQQDAQVLLCRLCGLYAVEERA